MTNIVEHAVSAILIVLGVSFLLSQCNHVADKPDPLKEKGLPDSERTLTFSPVDSPPIKGFPVNEVMLL